MFDSTLWKIKLWAFDSARFLYTIIWSDHLTCDLNSFVQIVGRLFLPASLLKVGLGHWCCLQNWRDLSKRALSFFLGWNYSCLLWFSQKRKCGGEKNNCCEGVSDDQKKERGFGAIEITLSHTCSPLVNNKPNFISFLQKKVIANCRRWKF